MSNTCHRNPREPVLAEYLSSREDPSLPLDVVAVGRMRLPLTLNHRPWITLYRFPDGRLLWTVRLWDGDRPVHRCIGAATLLRFARVNQLWDFENQVEALLLRAVEGHAAP